MICIIAILYLLGSNPCFCQNPASPDPSGSASLAKAPTAAAALAKASTGVPPAAAALPHTNTPVPTLTARDSTPAAPALTPGVSYTLARYRSALLHNITYTLQFHIPAEKEMPVAAGERMTFDLADNHNPLQIDFKGPPGSVQQITINGTAAPVMHEQEHLLLPQALLHEGPNTVDLVFMAGNSALNRNGDFLYTLLVPDRARTLFPCFDQPDLKAIFTLSLEIPANWKAVANAPVAASPATAHPATATPAANPTIIAPPTPASGDTRSVNFLPSDRISTYLFSFVAGKFTEAERIEDGRRMHFYYRETDSTKLRMSLEPVFRIQADALHFMQDYTGIAYPFQKFDCIGIPDFQFGGMEHVGAIQYKANALFLDSAATRDQLIGRANVLSHETAHMWFGDLVTMTWFNDVWMKEVFANFMADKISNITMPDGKYDLKFLTDHFQAAYSIDRTEGAHPIRQQLDNLQEAGSLYGNIIYHKAPIVMRQLERLMGAEAFRDGLRDYLKKYAGGNAGWPDLIDCLQQHTTANLHAWNRVWVNEAGRPQFSYRLLTAGGKISDLEIHQRGEDGSARVWPQLFGLALVYKDRVEELTVNMNAASIHLPAAIGKATPLCILFNANGLGYGLFPIDQRSIPWLHPPLSPLMRASAYINVYENMLDGRSLRPRELLAFDRRALLQEPEELNLNILLDQLVSIFWRFLPPATRDSLAPGLEKDLWAAMQTVPSGNEKKLLFRAYANIVLTKTGEDSLYAVWETQQPPAGVKLSEDDYTNLAASLAIRAYPNAQKILAQQASRIQNKDRQQRLAFLMPSLSSDVGERDRFFASLQEAGNRKKEAWVITALSYLHHPLRTTASEKYLPQSLEWLEDLQRTGDVFFPQSWLQTSLSWYQTPTAAATVRNFLQQHPDYNPKLRAKILQAADNLFRAERLTK